MFLRLLEKFWGCKHKRFSFPQTVDGVTHVCCLECGQEFDYDWDLMEVSRKAVSHAGRIAEVVRLKTGAGCGEKRPTKNEPEHQATYRKT